MSGQHRLHIGQGHEDDVATQLRLRGWTVHPWGQGLFDDGETGAQVRVALVTREPKTLWRWIPDMIAIKGSTIYLVDPKTDLRGDTPNFSLEVDAYMAHSMMRCLGLPIMYVWQDLSCNAPHLLRPVGWFLEPQRGKTNGSGTPFVLVRKTDQLPFDKVFGSAPIQKAG